MKNTRFEAEKTKQHGRVSDRLQKTLDDLEAQDRLVRDLEKSTEPRDSKKPPYK